MVRLVARACQFSGSRPAFALSMPRCSMRTPGNGERCWYLRTTTYGFGRSRMRKAAVVRSLQDKIHEASVSFFRMGLT